MLLQLTGCLGLVLAMVLFKEGWKGMYTIRLMRGENIADDDVSVLGVSSAVSILLFYYRRDQLDEYNAIVRGEDARTRPIYANSMALDMATEDIPGIVLSAIFLSYWGYEALPASTISLAFSVLKVLFMLYKIRLSRKKDLAEAGPQTGSLLNGSDVLRPSATQNVLLWWLMYRSGLLICCHLEPYLPNSTFGAWTIGCQRGTELPQSFSINHRDGNASCLDLNVTSVGACSQDATQVFDYCGWKTMCGTGFDDPDAGGYSSKCWVNLDCRCPAKDLSGARGSDCSGAEKECSSESSSGYSLYTGALVVAIFTCMKELVKLLCTGVVMMDVPGVKEEEEDGEDDGNGDNEDNGAELHKWLAPIAVQSPLSILLVFFRPSEIGNYAVLVTDPDQWHNMLFFWGLGADLAIESGPVVIMATVFIALWGPSDKTVFATVSIVLTFTKLVVVIFIVARIRQNHGKAVQSRDDTASVKNRELKVRLLTEIEVQDTGC
eukprot:m.125002 g.125002  ORF g.125002 m.125002 type:complete len:492 (-) comp22098_c0_seq12:64-1539(-)